MGTTPWPLALWCAHCVGAWVFPGLLCRAALSWVRGELVTTPPVCTSAQRTAWRTGPRLLTRAKVGKAGEGGRCALDSHPARSAAAHALQTPSPTDPKAQEVWLAFYTIGQWVFRSWRHGWTGSCVCQQQGMVVGTWSAALLDCRCRARSIRRLQLCHTLSKAQGSEHQVWLSCT